MDAGHAQAALESKEGAERAQEDFRAGNTVNPFTKHEGWRMMAWNAQMERQINRRDCIAAEHDRTKCCWEHDWHIQRWNKMSQGITSCPACFETAEIARKKIEREKTNDRKNT